MSQNTNDEKRLSRELACRQWIDMRDHWAQAHPIIVEDYMADPEFPRDDDDLVLDLIYGEFVLREQAGEAPTPDEYAARFPHLKDRIVRQLELHFAISAASTDLTVTRTRIECRISEIPSSD